MSVWKFNKQRIKNYINLLEKELLKANLKQDERNLYQNNLELGHIKLIEVMHEFWDRHVANRKQQPNILAGYLRPHEYWEYGLYQENYLSWTSTAGKRSLEGI